MVKVQNAADKTPVWTTGQQCPSLINLSVILRLFFSTDLDDVKIDSSLQLFISYQESENIQLSNII